MKRLVLPAWLAELQSRVTDLARDKRGVAAVEFAFIVPLMLVMFFGTLEFSSGVAVDRKVSMVAQSLSDLTSRYLNVTDTDMTNFAIIAGAMMTPYSASPLKTRITELYIDPTTGAAKAEWSKTTDSSVYPAYTLGFSVPGVPASLISRDGSGNIVAGQYLILTEVQYIYTPTVGYVMKSAVTLSDKSYMRPRISTCVLYSSSSTGTCPTT